MNEEQISKASNIIGIPKTGRPTAGDFVALLGPTIKKYPRQPCTFSETEFISEAETTASY